VWPCSRKKFFFLENSVFWAEAPRKLPQSKDY